MSIFKLFVAFAFLLNFFLYSKAQASVLDVFYAFEQIKLNHSGYTQNIVNVDMPWGESCRFSYFYHRTSKDTSRTLVVHGFLDRSLTWRKTIAQIPQNSPYKKNLVLIDLPHHGSSACAGVNSFERAEVFLRSSIHHVQKRHNFKVHEIWTGSLGSLFGLALMHTYPEARLKMLVPPLFGLHLIDQKQSEILSINTVDQVKSFLKKVPPQDKKIPMMDSVAQNLLPRALVAKQLVKNIDGNRLWAGYLKASNPVKILVSKDDLLIPIEQIDPRYVNHKKAIYNVIDNKCGHSVLKFCSDFSTPFLTNDGTLEISKNLKQKDNSLNEMADVLRP